MTNKRIQAKAVRELCGDVSDMTIWRWLHERDFPEPCKIGNRRYWKESEIIAWLDAQAEQATEQGAA